MDDQKKRWCPHSSGDQAGWKPESSHGAVHCFLGSIQISRWPGALSGVGCLELCPGPLWCSGRMFPIWSHSLLGYILPALSLLEMPYSWTVDFRVFAAGHTRAVCKQERFKINSDSNRPILMRSLHSIRHSVNAQHCKVSVMARSLKGAKAPRPLAL